MIEFSAGTGVETVAQAAIAVVKATGQHVRVKMNGTEIEVHKGTTFAEIMAEFWKQCAESESATR